MHTKGGVFDFPLICVCISAGHAMGPESIAEEEAQDGYPLRDGHLGPEFSTSGNYHDILETWRGS